MNIINEIMQYRQKEFARGKTPREIPLTQEQQLRLQRWNDQTKTTSVADNGQIIERKPIDLSGGSIFGMKIIPS